MSRHDAIINDDENALASALRDARRRNDKQKIIQKCESLLEWPLGMAPGVPGEIGDALRWVLDDGCVCPECEGDRGFFLGFKVDGALQWHDCETCDGCGKDQPLATRIANMARSLSQSGPQPVETEPCRGCRGSGLAPKNDRYHSPWRKCYKCKGKYLQDIGPAPTHAMQLYIESLMLALGDGWWLWLVKHMHGSIWPTPKGNVLVRPGRSPDSIDAWWIREDGKVKCGAECPLLPKVI